MTLAIEHPSVRSARQQSLPKWRKTAFQVRGHTTKGTGNAGRPCVCVRQLTRERMATPAPRRASPSGTDVRFQEAPS